MAKIHSVAVAFCVRLGRTLLGRYGLAVLFTALAVFLRWLMPDVLEETPYLAFYPAIVAAAAFGGLGPGLLATVGSFLCVDLLFDVSPGQVDWSNPIVLERLVVFLAGGFGTSFIGGAQRASENRERQQAEVLRKSENQFRRLIETSTFGIAMIDLAGGIRYFNSLLLDLFGYTAGEVQAGLVRWDRMTPPEFLNLTQRAVREIQTTGSCTPFEMELLARDGRRIPVFVGVSTLEDRQNEQPVIAAFVTDTTQIQKTSQALRESELFYRQILESIPGMVFTTRPDGYCDYQSHQWVEFTGIPMEQHLGDGWNTLLHPDDRGRAYDAWREAVEERDDYDLEYRVRRHDGEYRWFRVIGRPIRDAEGRIVRWFGVCLDIEDIKRAEDALQQVKDELESRVGERTKELQETVEELKRSNADLEQFAYVSSHDLQEPLRMVSSYVGLLARNYKDQLDAEAGEFIGFAVEGATRMSNLIKDLLEYSRVNTHGKPFQAVDCNHVLQTVLENLYLRIQEAGAEITHEPLPTVMGDETQLIQVFQNLIGNGIKFRREGVVPKIHILVEKKDGQWLFGVKDNGIGIAPEYFNRIFVIFQRLHTRQKYPGSGIGLSIVKRVVERHGGHVCIDSQPGQGTTFFFTIPERPPETALESVAPKRDIFCTNT